MRVKVSVDGQITEMMELYERLEVCCSHYNVSLRDFLFMYYFHVHGPMRLDRLSEVPPEADEIKTEE